MEKRKRWRHMAYLPDFGSFSSSPLPRMVGTFHLSYLCGTSLQSGYAFVPLFDDCSHLYDIYGARLPQYCHPDTVKPVAFIDTRSQTSQPPSQIIITHTPPPPFQNANVALGAWRSLVDTLESHSADGAIGPVSGSTCISIRRTRSCCVQ